MQKPIPRQIMHFQCMVMWPCPLTLRISLRQPEAPKGGTLRMGVVGTFDSLNPFVLKSMRTTARGLFGDQDFGNLVYETLMQRSRDEPFTLYGLLAEKVAVDPERKWVEFTLSPKAKWSDGEPVTVDDVLFTYDILTERSPAL